MAFTRQTQENFQWSGLADNITDFDDDTNFSSIKVMNPWGSPTEDYSPYRNFVSVNEGVTPLLCTQTVLGGGSYLGSWGAGGTDQSYREYLMMAGSIKINKTTNKSSFTYAKIDGQYTDGYMKIPQPFYNGDWNTRGGTLGQCGLMLNIQCHDLRPFELVPLVGISQRGYFRDRNTVTDNNGNTYSKPNGLDTGVPYPPYLCQGVDGNISSNNVSEYDAGIAITNSSYFLRSQQFAQTWLWWMHDGLGNALLMTGPNVYASTSNSQTTRTLNPVNKMYGIRDGYLQWAPPAWLVNYYAEKGASMLTELWKNYRVDSPNRRGDSNTSLFHGMGIYSVDGNYYGDTNDERNSPRGPYQILWQGPSTNADLKNPANLYVSTHMVYRDNKHIQNGLIRSDTGNTYSSDHDAQQVFFSGKFESATFQDVPGPVRTTRYWYQGNTRNAGNIVDFTLQPTYGSKTEIHSVSVGVRNGTGSTTAAGQAGTVFAPYTWPRNITHEFPVQGASYDPIIAARASSSLIVDDTGNPMELRTDGLWDDLDLLLDQNDDTVALCKKFGPENAIYISLNQATGDANPNDSDMVTDFIITVKNIQQVVIGNYALYAALCDGNKAELAVTDQTNRVEPPLKTGNSNPSSVGSYVISFTVSDLVGVTYGDIKGGFIKVWAEAL